MSYFRKSLGALLHEDTHADDGSTPPIIGGQQAPTVALPPPQPAYGTGPAIVNTPSGAVVLKSTGGILGLKTQTVLIGAAVVLGGYFLLRKK